jgi:hypothetical protein
MNRYEQATLSTVVVERMQKVIAQSESKKDQLIFAQCLDKLEMEKKHHQEIAQIREEQMKLMA